MPPNGGTRTSLVDPRGNPLVITGQLLGPEVTNADFSPGQPITPVRQEPIRTWDFPVGINTFITPRSDEPFGFPALRAFANVELVRMAIETRKDQLERLDWQIKPRDEKKARKGGSDSRIDTLTAFWRKPGMAGGRVAPFATWLRVAVEDLLAIDAPAFEKRRDRGGKLIGLDSVPGDTIKVLVDETGRLPQAPYPAYEQIIKGRIWATLTTEDLLYSPRNPRPNHLLGFGPVEQIIVTINTIINRQARQLAYFTEGNTPPGFVTGAEGWTSTQLKELQTWVNSTLSGNPAERAKLQVLPFGSAYHSLKDAPLKDDFDEWLARIVAYAFSLPPTPFIKQMNRSTGQTDADRAMEEGLEPLKLWVKRLVDGVNEDEFGVTDLEFAWSDTPEIDPAKQAEIDNINLRNASSTVDEVRDGRGLDPLPDGLGEKPMIFTSTGAMTLEQVLKAAEDSLNPVETPTPLPDNQQPAPGQAEPAAPGDQPAPKPKPAPAAKLAKAADPISPDRPKARRHAASLRKAIAPVLAKAGDEVGAEVGRRLRGFHKAADDSGAVKDAALAAEIAAAIDLSGLDDLSDAAFEDLFEVAYDSATLGLASVGVRAEGDLVDQVHQRAVDWARARAAEMVSVQGDQSIIDATREMIRATIAAGLQDNTGAEAIAEAVQTSTAFSADRAELIAQTEIANANGQGKLEGWRVAADTGLTLQKFWDAEADCCDDCQANEDASPVGLEDSFPSGDDAEGAHPHCRCSTHVEVVEPDDTE